MVTYFCQSNALAVAVKLKATVEALPKATAVGERAVATAILLSTTRALEELVYDPPLPASYHDFGLDDRTGALLAGEAMLATADGYLITTENSGLAGKNPEEYAAWRHAYQKYPAPWREVGLERVKDKLPDIYVQAVMQGLPGGVVQQTSPAMPLAAVTA